MPAILYAEDDPQVADFVRMLFEREDSDLTIDLAVTGPDCLRRMAQGGYDLLLLDLVLPGRDGLAILSELARRGDPTPVIVISSHGQFEQTVSALRAGAIDCIDKKSGRFLDTARIVHGFLEQRTQPEPETAERPEIKTVVLLERDVPTALEIATILGRECPQLRVRTVASRSEWDHLIATDLPCDALVLNDDWAFDDLTDMLRDFRSADRGGPALLISRGDKLEVIIAAYALGCRDCVVQKHGYQFELARSLNHLLRETQAVGKA